MTPNAGISRIPQTLDSKTMESANVNPVSELWQKGYKEIKTH